MDIRNSIAVLAVGFGLCPSLGAVSYTWDFTGSNVGSNCTGSPTSCSTSAGNSIQFSSTPGGPTVKASAWYLTGGTGGGTFQKATVGQYSPGLGVCYPGEDCSQPDHQVDNSGKDEYILFEFSTPVDPSTMNITTTNNGDLDASYFLGGNAGQNMDLTGKTMTTLSSLGFGSITNNNNSTSATSRGVDLTAGVPSGSVNAVLFGAKYGNTDDYFKIAGMGGTGAPAVPEPSSVILLFTATVLGLRLSRKKKASQATTE